MVRRKNKGQKQQTPPQQKPPAEKVEPKKPRSEIVQDTKLDLATENIERETALEYVNMIKKEFAGSPEVYQTFSKILKDFDAWKMDTDDFIMKVCNLFSDKPNLLSGLNRFLPAGFQIDRGDDGVYRCKMIPPFKKFEKKLKVKVPVGENSAAAGSSAKTAEISKGDEEYEDEEDEDEEIYQFQDFIYDVGHAQDLYKNYCKERKSKNVEEVIARGKEIREIVVPLLQWLEPDYFTDSRKGLLFTKMMRCIKKILMLESRYKLFMEKVAPGLGHHAEIVMIEFLNHHCMAYHRLVEGYMQTNDLFPEDTPLAPDVPTASPSEC